MKKLIIIISTIFLIILIYNVTKTNKLTYISIGDGLSQGCTPYKKVGYGYSDYVYEFLKRKDKIKKYNKTFSNEDYRITDLINDIENHKNIIKEGKRININQSISNASFITISIGRNDLYYKIKINEFSDYNLEKNELYLYINELFNDYKKLLNKIRKYNNCPIILIGFYSPVTNKINEETEEVYNYINNLFLELSKNKDIYYVETFQAFKKNKHFLPNPIDSHPTIAGYKYISNKIIEILVNNKIIT